MLQIDWTISRTAFFRTIDSCFLSGSSRFSLDSSVYNGVLSSSIIRRYLRAPITACSEAITPSANVIQGMAPYMRIRIAKTITSKLVDAEERILKASAIAMPFGTAAQSRDHAY